MLDVYGEQKNVRETQKFPHHNPLQGISLRGGVVVNANYIIDNHLLNPFENSAVRIPLCEVMCAVLVGTYLPVLILAFAIVFFVRR